MTPVLAIRTPDRGPPAPSIPLRNVQAGQLFVPEKQPDCVCALLTTPTGASVSLHYVGSDAGANAVAVVCIAAKEVRHAGLAVLLHPFTQVRLVELVSKAEYCLVGRT